MAGCSRYGNGRLAVKEGSKMRLPRLFVGSSSESLHVAEAIQSNLEANSEVRVWNQDLLQTGNSALEDLLKLTNDFDYAVFVWSSDDMLISRGEDYVSPRDNVVFEAGMFYGVLGKERVFLLLPLLDKPKVPTDLAGISHLFYRAPSDGNYRAALGPASRAIQERVKTLGCRARAVGGDKESLVPTVFKHAREAWTAMKKDCYESETIAILGNRGLGAFGTDQSIISLAEVDRFARLRKIRIILLGENSRWLHPGFIQLRVYESVDTFKKDLRACHDIMEGALGQLSIRLGRTKSGIRYHWGEPKFGMLLTDRVGYVYSYGEPPSIQVVDLPVYRFEKNRGSLYGAFKRHFDDLWHNRSAPGRFEMQHIDLETSAGGIVIAEHQNRKYVALLRRHDGYWVLPKGHRMHLDATLEETAIREVAEETGLSTDDFYIERPIGYYSYDETAESANGTKVVHLYLMRCKSQLKPLLKPLEHAEGTWWDISTPLPEMLYTYQRSYLHEIIQAEGTNPRTE
jgi:8-oxo-dGTP pyrophosphatase MutT (NUDIX family)